MHENQTTISEDISLEGYSLDLNDRQLHESNAILRPGKKDTGYVFVLCGQEIQANIFNAIQFNDENWTSLTKKGHTVKFVEHYLAVFRALRLDNLRIYLNSEFCPFISGGDIKLYEHIRPYLVNIDNSQRTYLTFNKDKNDFEHQQDDSFLRLSGFNSEGFSVCYVIGQKKRGIPQHQNTFDFLHDDVTKIIEAPSIFFRENKIYEEMFQNALKQNLGDLVSFLD